MQQEVLFFPLSLFFFFKLSSDFVPIRMLLRNKELQFTFSLGSKEMAINLNKFASIFVSFHRCPLSVVRCCFLYVASFHAFCLYKYKNAKSIKHVSLFLLFPLVFPTVFGLCGTHTLSVFVFGVSPNYNVCECVWAGGRTNGSRSQHRPPLLF